MLRTWTRIRSCDFSTRRSSCGTSCWAQSLFAIGYFGWDLYTACSFVAYGMFLRLVYVLHVTWFVNSATHMWGYRNYETTDDSRNLWWVGLLAYGEGWHNNHHAYQRMARHGHRWWEFDMTYWHDRGHGEARPGLEPGPRRARATEARLSAAHGEGPRRSIARGNPRSPAVSLSRHACRSNDTTQASNRAGSSTQSASLRSASRDGSPKRRLRRALQPATTLSRRALPAIERCIFAS